MVTDSAILLKYSLSDSLYFSCEFDEWNIPSTNFKLLFPDIKNFL